MLETRFDHCLTEEYRIDPFHAEAELRDGKAPSLEDVVCGKPKALLLFLARLSDLP